MTREEAEYFLRGISYKLGNIAVEYLSEKDGEKMREAIKALKQEPTPKNDLGVDCVSRQAVIKILVEAKEFGSWDDSSQINRLDAIDNVDMLPSVTPQEPEPMVEIDLDYVIKQKYIEREVLDKIRAEIADYQKQAVYSDDVVMTKRMVLAIIDKYKAESEAT